jgi:hypothetical protein
MKVAFSEESDYEKFTQSPNQVRVIPTNFQKEHRTMLSHLYSLVNKEYLCIPAKYDKLAISLRTKNVTMNYLLEDQGKFVEQTKEMQTKTVKGEEVNVYVRGAARDTYSMEWDKKKAQDMLTNKKYFGEDTVNITNPSETVYIVKFPHSNPSRTGFDKEDFMNLTYQALWDKARTTPSPQLEALKRRQNPYS